MLCALQLVYVPTQLMVSLVSLSASSRSSMALLTCVYKPCCCLAVAQLEMHDHEARCGQMKVRQDLELRAAEEAAHRFRAHQLPRTTSEPR